MRVVVLTHVFPRAAGDPLGAFLLHLAHGFDASVQQLVVAPHAAGLREQETLERIPVTRFRYAPDASETLAYTGVMHEQVAKGIGGKLLFARFLLAYLRDARHAVRTGKPDVIHAHWWLPGGLVGALVSKWTRTPLLITTHGTDVEQLRQARWTKSLARFAFGQARVITCGSNYLRQQLVALDAADAARVQVIPMPVNPLFTNRASQVANRAAPFKILTVARLTLQKNIDTLIDSLAILRHRGIEARLSIAGDGDQLASLQAQTHSKNLDSVVEFLGMRPQSELPQLYGASDVFVLPSVREGMGLVLAEALLCGVPVIATNSGGVTDIVREGETGLLFPERDANALADAIQKLANDSQLAARLAENGRAAVSERFTPNSVAAQFLQAYERAIH